MREIFPLANYKLRLTVLSLFFCTSLYGQSDSISFGGSAGLKGMWQTGNLNQVSLMPTGKIRFAHSINSIEITGIYHYIKVGDFEAKNDLWFHSLYRIRPGNLFYFSANAVSGFALSYRIDHSFVAGVGGGMNIIKHTPGKYLQFHLYGSYLDFKFEGEQAFQSLAFSSLIRANIPLTDRFNFGWELESYHSMKETGFWGGSNLFQLIFHLTKNFSLNINHQTFYNHQTASNIEKINTQMLFGFQYSFSKIN